MIKKDKDMTFDDLVKLPKQDADALYEDAKAAGLALNFIPALSIARN